LEKTGFPLVSSAFPNEVPPVAGIDNAKLKVFEDHKANLAKVEEAKAKGETPPILLLPGMKVLEAYIDETETAAKEGKPAPKVLMTTLDSDLVTLLRQKRAGKPVEARLEEELTKRKIWWDTQGYPHYEQDKGPLVDARLYG